MRLNLTLALEDKIKTKEITLLVGLLFVLTIKHDVPAGENSDDFSWIRGSNYMPSYARNDVQIWMDYDPNEIASIMNVNAEEAAKLFPRRNPDNL